MNFSAPFRAALLASLIANLAVSSRVEAQFSMNDFMCQKANPHDNPELLQLTRDDQARRHGDTSVPRDSVRLARVFTLYHANSIRTARDFANASLILQHGHLTEHYLLAQEFTVVSLRLGCGGLQGQFMLPATTYRLLSSLGLNPDFLKDAVRSGLDHSQGMEIVSGPQAFQFFPLSMALLSQRQALLEQLRTLRQQHPDYPWQVFKNENSSDSLLAFVKRTPEVAAAFAQAHITPQQWDSVAGAIHGAIDYAFFKPIAPRPMESVSGALGFSSIGVRNIDFVVAHQEELRHLGYAAHFIDPEHSELARSNMVPVMLPPDTLAATWPDPCPAPLTGHDTLTDNPELLQLMEQLPRAGHSVQPSGSAALRSAHLLTLLQRHAIRTPRDSMRAAIVSESGPQPEDAFRAHNLAVAVIGVCGSHALQLAATSEDRFLALLGLQQRFGTLPRELVPIDMGPARITNWVRQLVDVSLVP